MTRHQSYNPRPLSISLAPRVAVVGKKKSKTKAENDFFPKLYIAGVRFIFMRIPGHREATAAAAAPEAR